MTTSRATLRGRINLRTTSRTNLKTTSRTDLDLDLDLFNFCNNVTRIYPEDNYCLIEGYFLKYVKYEKLNKIHQSNFL